jgi:GNAT superfamily N-acetyltransferase
LPFTAIIKRLDEELVLRNGRKGDESALALVHRSAALAAYPWVPPERWRDADWSTRLAAGGVIIAEYRGSLIALAHVLLREVGSLYVMPSMQRRGVGTALLGAAERRLGPGPAVLWVIPRNGEARAFYEQTGWVFDGGRRDDIWGPEVRYRKVLSG